MTLKNAECIKEEADFTTTKYHNICTGEVHVVPTGVSDYMIGIPIMIILALIALAGVAMFVGLIIAIIEFLKD